MPRRTFAPGPVPSTCVPLVTVGVVARLARALGRIRREGPAPQAARLLAGELVQQEEVPRARLAAAARESEDA